MTIAITIPWRSPNQLAYEETRFLDMLFDSIKRTKSMTRILLDAISEKGLSEITVTGYGGSTFTFVWNFQISEGLYLSTSLLHPPPSDPKVRFALSEIPLEYSDWDTYADMEVTVYPNNSEEYTWNNHMGKFSPVSWIEFQKYAGTTESFSYDELRGEEFLAKFSRDALGSATKFKLLESAGK